MSLQRVKALIEAEWDSTIVPCLQEYIKVPCQSPHYDEEWATNGLLGTAFDVLIGWLKAQTVRGLTFQYQQAEGRTPFLLVDIPGTTPTPKTLLMYGHMDKQPPMLPWSEGLDPYVPVLRDGKLYGRAGADDGYALLSAVTTIAALQKENIPHSRIVVIIEGCEESGSFDLPYYIESNMATIGDVDLVICLDSGAQDYERMWLTTSLRGVVGGVLSVSTAAASIHSGVGGGVIPDPFRIARTLLDRLEDPTTGRFKIELAHTTPPPDVVAGLRALNDVDFMSQFNILPGVQLGQKDNLDVALRNFWQPSMTVTGSNYPPPAKAGNVLHGTAQLKLSVRIPPNVDPDAVTAEMKKMLEKDPPLGAHVRFEGEFGGAPWSAPALSTWLHQSLDNASSAAFGKPYGLTGQGGSIPFMGMLGRMFPQAQFVITGVLGPHSNAHGPNEFLHIPFGKGITTCVAHVVKDHYVNTPH